MSNAYGPGGRNMEGWRGGAGSTSTYDPGYASNPAAGPKYQNYPPPHNAANPSYTPFNTTPMKNESDVTVGYTPARTPSPTPSEVATLNRKGIIDWKAISHWRYWIRREWLCAYSFSTIWFSVF